MSALSQAFPPNPNFTERDLPDQTGKVFIVTGAASGVGFELAKILYQKNGAVYIATRSTKKIDDAIRKIKSDIPTSLGRLEPLVLDLSNLSSIKPAAEKFLAREQRLDVLVHNAGVMTPPAGSTTKLGHDLEMGTNCLGPFLLSQCLESVLRSTAQRSTQPGNVRVVWVTSLLAVGTAPGGIVFDSPDGPPKVLSDPMKNYMQSKVGNTFLAHESAKRLADDGIFCMSVHPGLMKTELQRHANPMMGKVMGLIFKPAKYGAYSELFAGFSPDVKENHNGGFVIPWGRHGRIPDHIAAGFRSQREGGSGLSRSFWDWCDEETKSFR